MAFKLQFVTVTTDTNQRQVLDTIILDASVTELHESDADVTEFPVEEGSDITDNIRMLPKGLKVEAIITDFSLAGPSGAGSKRAHASGFKGYAKGTYLTLEDYQEKGTLIDVETGLKSYQNMVIKSLSTPRDAKTGTNAVRTTIILKRIIIAQSQTVVIKQADPKGQPSSPKGPKTPTAADAGQQEKKSAAGFVIDKASDGRLGKALNDSAKAVGGLFK